MEPDKFVAVQVENVLLVPPLVQQTVAKETLKMLSSYSNKIQTFSQFQMRHDLREEIDL